MDGGGNRPLECPLSQPPPPTPASTLSTATSPVLRPVFGPFTCVECTSCLWYLCVSPVFFFSSLFFFFFFYRFFLFVGRTDLFVIPSFLEFLDRASVFFFFPPSSLLSSPKSPSRVLHFSSRRGSSFSARFIDQIAMKEFPWQRENLNDRTA